MFAMTVSMDNILYFRKILSEAASGHEGVADRFSFFMDSIFCREISSEEASNTGVYRMLFIGTSNLSRLSDMFAVDCSGIGRIALKSPLRLQRTEERNDVIIQFKSGKKKITEGDTTRIEKSFLIRGKNIDISRHSEGIPPLVIEDSAQFLAVIDKDLRVLDGRDLISLITINIPVKSSSSVQSLVNRVDIIPENTLYSKRNGSNSSHKSHVILRLLQSYGINPYVMNFIVLNSLNEAALNAFIALLYAYNNYYALPEGKSFAVLKTVFHVYETEFLRKSEIFSRLKYKPEDFINMFSFYDDLELRHDAVRYIYLLSFLISYFSGKIEGIPNINKKIQNFFGEYKRIFSLLPTEILSDSEKIRDKYSSLRTTMRKNKNRADIFKEFLEFYGYLFNFSEIYNSKKIQLMLKKKREKLENKKNTYLRKKRRFRNLWLFIEYMRDDDEFLSFIKKEADEVGDLTESMFHSLDFGELTKFVEKIDAFLPELIRYNLQYDFMDELIRIFSEKLIKTQNTVNNIIEA